MNAQQFKKRKILFRDYMSFVLFLFLFVHPFVGPLGLLLLPINTILLLKRINFIHRTLTVGSRTTGNIIKKFFFSGEWRIKYSYTVGGKTYETRNFVLGFKLPFTVGDSVEIAYDPQKPSQAFLPILYK